MSLANLVRACATAAAFCAAAEPARGQWVSLEVRPRPGDTLGITINHAVTITGGPRSFPDSATTVTTSYFVATREIVERADARGTLVLAIIDSVRMKTTGSFGASPFPGVDRGMEKLRVRLRIHPDGGSEMLEGLSQLDPELREVLAVMPAVLPGAPVRIGEAWTRDLPLPAEGSGSASQQAAGTLRATFRLDSLTGNGDLAWISLQGRLEPMKHVGYGEGSVVSRMSGSLTGVLCLDRRRGWLAYSSASVVMFSTVTTPTGAPIEVTVRMVQSMQLEARRR